MYKSNNIKNHMKSRLFPLAKVQKTNAQKNKVEKWINTIPYDEMLDFVLFSICTSHFGSSRDH